MPQYNVHLTSRFDWFKNFSPDRSQRFGIANGTKLKNTGTWKTSIPWSTIKNIDALNVGHVPDLAVNLLAVNIIAE